MSLLFAVFWFCLGGLIGGIGVMWLLLWPDARAEKVWLDAADDPRPDEKDFRA